jgi:hypothetical protein
MSVFTPGVTASYALQGKPATFKGAMLFYGFNTILRAGGCKTTTRP